MLRLLVVIGVSVVLLYLPGFFFMRALRFSRVASLACAPLVSVFGFAALPIAYYEAGVACSFASVFSVLLALCLAAYLVSRFAVGRGGGELVPVKEEPLRVGRLGIPFAWAMIALYVAVGAFVCWMVFVLNLSHGDSFYCRWDNQTHINLVQAFLDSGKWSSLHASVYLASPDNAVPFTKAGGFYPAAWNDMVALLCSLTGQRITLCANALNIAVAACVYPASMFLLIAALFPRERPVMAAGAVVTMAFSAFPWGFFTKGPLYPNFLSFVLMVALLAVALHVLEDAPLTKGRFARLALVCLVGLGALALSQPNAAFSAFLFAAAYAGHRAWGRASFPGAAGGPRSRLRGVAAVAGVAVAALAVWAVCLRLPFLKGVVGYHSTIACTPAEAAGRVAVLWLGAKTMVASQPDYVLAAVTLAGIVACLARRRFWVLVPALCCAVSYVASQSEIEPVRQFFAGFWYSDSIRLAACYELFITPVAALGLALTARFPVWAYRRVRNRRGRHTRGDGGFTVLQGAWSVAVAAALAVAFLYPAVPWIEGKAGLTGIGKIEARLHSCYGKDKKAVYATAERKFVDEAVRQVPDGALVINQPHDGSVFAYGYNGLNTYYRKGTRDKETPESAAIATRLVHYADDPEVQSAVRATGAQYVLQLDQGVPYAEGKWMPQYHEYTQEYWAGINDIRDDTPGFTVVLADGDMRLYKIG